MRSKSYFTIDALPINIFTTYQEMEDIPMPIATLSAKGQITLPARLRKSLGMRPHDRLVVETAGDAIVIRRTADFFELEGFLGKSLPAEEERRRMMQAVSARGKRTRP